LVNYETIALFLTTVWLVPAQW